MRIYPALVTLPGAAECTVNPGDTYGQYQCIFEVATGDEASQGEALVRRAAACFSPPPAVQLTNFGVWRFQISTATVSGGADGSGRAGRVIFHVSTGLD